MAKAEKIVTTEFRISLPTVFSPGRLSDKFELTMMFEKTQAKELAKMKALMNKVVKAKWGDKVPAKLQTPFASGNDERFAGYIDYPDKIIVKANSMYAPGVLDENKQPMLGQKEFYGGCYAVASVHAYCWEYMGKKGVNFGLDNVMKTKDGEPFSSGSNPLADFESVVVENDEPELDLDSEDSILDLI